MSSLAILQSLKESILTASVKAVYGEPIAAQGKTVIPVAKVIYGHGAGQEQAALAMRALGVKVAGAVEEPELSLLAS